MSMPIESLHQGSRLELSNTSDLYRQYRLYRSIAGSEESLLAMAVLAQIRQPMSLPDVTRLVFALEFMPISEALILHQKGHLRTKLLDQGVTDDQIANTSTRLRRTNLSQWENLGLITITHQTGTKRGALVNPDLIQIIDEQVNYVERITQNVVGQIGSPGNSFAGTSLVDIFGQRTTEGATEANMVDWAIMQLAVFSAAPLTVAQITQFLSPDLNPKFIRERCISLHDRGIIEYAGYEGHQDNIRYGMSPDAAPIAKHSPLTDAAYNYLERHPGEYFTASELAERLRRVVPEIDEKALQKVLYRGVGRYFTQVGTKEAQIRLSDTQRVMLRALFKALSSISLPTVNPLSSPEIVSVVLSNMKEKEISWEQRREQILSFLRREPRATARYLASICGITEGGMTKYLTRLEKEHYVDHIEVSDTFRWRVLSEKQRRILVNRYLAEERRERKAQEIQRRLTIREHARRSKRIIAETRRKMRDVVALTAVQEYARIDQNYPTLSLQQMELLYQYIDFAQTDPTNAEVYYAQFWREIKRLPDFPNEEAFLRRYIALEEDCKPEIHQILFYTKLLYVKKYVESWIIRTHAATSFEELLQTGVLALFHAISNYENGIQFEQTLPEVLENALRETRHNLSQQGLSLELPLDAEDTDSATLGSQIADEKEESDAITLAKVEDNLSVCSADEQRIIQLILQGEQIIEIALQLDMHEEAVEALIMSAGEKLREVIE